MFQVNIGLNILFSFHPNFLCAGEHQSPCIAWSSVDLLRSAVFENCRATSRGAQPIVILITDSVPSEATDFGISNGSSDTIPHADITDQLPGTSAEQPQREDQHPFISSWASLCQDKAQMYTIVAQSSKQLISTVEAILEPTLPNHGLHSSIHNGTGARTPVLVVLSVSYDSFVTSNLNVLRKTCDDYSAYLCAEGPGLAMLAQANTPSDPHDCLKHSDLLIIDPASWFGFKDCAVVSYQRNLQSVAVHFPYLTPPQVSLDQLYDTVLPTIKLWTIISKIGVQTIRDMVDQVTTLAETFVHLLESSYNLDVKYEGVACVVRVSYMLSRDERLIQRDQCRQIISNVNNAIFTGLEEDPIPVNVLPGENTHGTFFHFSPTRLLARCPTAIPDTQTIREFVLSLQSAADRYETCRVGAPAFAGRASKCINLQMIKKDEVLKDEHVLTFGCFRIVLACMRETWRNSEQQTAEVQRLTSALATELSDGPKLDYSHYHSGDFGLDEEVWKLNQPEDELPFAFFVHSEMGERVADFISVEPRAPVSPMEAVRQAQCAAELVVNSVQRVVGRWNEAYPRNNPIDLPISNTSGNGRPDANSLPMNFHTDLPHNVMKPVHMVSPVSDSQRNIPENHDIECVGDQEQIDGSNSESDEEFYSVLSDKIVTGHLTQNKVPHPGKSEKTSSAPKSTEHLTSVSERDDKESVQYVEKNHDQKQSINEAKTQQCEDKDRYHQQSSFLDDIIIGDYGPLDPEPSEPEDSSENVSVVYSIEARSEVPTHLSEPSDLSQVSVPVPGEQVTESSYSADVPWSWKERFSFWKNLITSEAPTRQFCQSCLEKERKRIAATGPRKTSLRTSKQNPNATLHENNTTKTKADGTEHSEGQDGSLAAQFEVTRSSTEGELPSVAMSSEENSGIDSANDNNASKDGDHSSHDNSNRSERSTDTSTMVTENSSERNLDAVSNPSRSNGVDEKESAMSPFWKWLKILREDNIPEPTIDGDNDSETLASGQRLNMATENEKRMRTGNEFGFETSSNESVSSASSEPVGTEGRNHSEGVSQSRPRMSGLLRWFKGKAASKKSIVDEDVPNFKDSSDSNDQSQDVMEGVSNGNIEADETDESQPATENSESRDDSVHGNTENSEASVSSVITFIEHDFSSDDDIEAENTDASVTDGSAQEENQTSESLQSEMTNTTGSDSDDVVQGNSGTSIELASVDKQEATTQAKSPRGIFRWLLFSRLRPKATGAAVASNDNTGEAAAGKKKVCEKKKKVRQLAEAEGCHEASSQGGRSIDGGETVDESIDGGELGHARELSPQQELDGSSGSVESKFDDTDTDLEYESAVEEVDTLSLRDDDSDSKCNSSYSEGLGVASQDGGEGGVGRTPSDSAVMSDPGEEVDDLDSSSGNEHLGEDVDDEGHDNRSGPRTVRSSALDDSMEAKEATVEMGDVGGPVNSPRRSLWTGSTMDQPQHGIVRPVQRKVVVGRIPRRVTRRRAPSSYEDPSSHSSSDESSEETEDTIGSSTDSSTSSSYGSWSSESSSGSLRRAH